MFRKVVLEFWHAEEHHSLCLGTAISTEQDPVLDGVVDAAR